MIQDFQTGVLNEALNVSSLILEATESNANELPPKNG